MIDDPEADELPTTVDVLRYGEGENARYMTVPGDDGTKVVGAHSREEGRRKRLRTLTVSVLVGLAGVVGYLLESYLPAFLSSVGVIAVALVYERVRTVRVPETVGRNVHAEEAVEEYDVEGYVEEVFVDEA